MKRIINIIYYKLNSFWDSIWLFLEYLIFVPKVHKKPKLIKLFTFGGVDYYTYESVKEIPFDTLNKLQPLLQAVYCNSLNPNIVRGFCLNMNKSLHGGNVSVLNLVKQVNDLKDFAEWKYDMNALIEILKLLLLPNGVYNEKAISFWLKQKDFIKFSFESSILFSLNTMLLDFEAFKEYLIEQANELERLNKLNGTKEGEQLIETVKMYLDIYKQ